MCGIAGFNWNDNQLINQMNRSQQYRGPDSGGVFVNSKVSLGHRRLSILDTSGKGAQPMQYKHLSITFNGEIYNFKEIKSSLESIGHRFRSQTDTEVILHAYLEWGPRCVERFNGMWAFAIYDQKNNQLFLSRDRFGVKPLYYYFNKTTFIFASTVSAIRCHPISLSLDTTALNRYFFQKYIGGEYTLFKEIKSLNPGHNAVLSLDSKPSLQIKRYYDLHSEINKQSQEPLTNRLAQFPTLLESAVQLRLISDVPVGSFLSGGLDSSLVSAICTQKHSNFNTFSIGFKEKSFDERVFAGEVASHLQTNHTTTELTLTDDLVETVIGSLDEPLADPSILPTFVVSALARKKVTVALSGDGADEVFGGYDTYIANQVTQFLSPSFIKLLRPLTQLVPPSEHKISRLFMLKRFFERHQANEHLSHLAWMAVMTNREPLLKQLSQNQVSQTYHLNQFNSLLGVQLVDMDNYLPGDILKKTDMASMAHGLEVRTPYLDFRLVPLVLSLPDEWKIKYFQQKVLLKQIAATYLPESIIDRRKRGFSVPINRLIKKSELLKHYLLSSDSFTHGLLDQAYVTTLFEQHVNNKKDYSRELWSIFVFNYWWKKYGI